MESTAQIEQFILAELAQGRGITAIAPSDNLLTRGIVDSHGVMELVGYLEQQYGISVEDADLTPENFESLANIQAFVERKQQNGHS